MNVAVAMGYPSAEASGAAHLMVWHDASDSEAWLFGPVLVGELQAN